MKGTLNIGIAPPEILGECIVTVPLGTTVRITKTMLMNSIPEYYQINDYPIGSIRIVGHNNTPTTLLAQTNQSDTIAYFRRLTTRIYKNSSGAIVAGEISSAQLDQSTGFRVTGVQIGSSYVTYVATAEYEGEESEFTTTITGRIRVNVVPNNNQPPNACDDFTINIPLYSATVINSDMLLNGYNDPDGDPASRIRIDGVPVEGMLLINGIQAEVGDIISISQIQQGALVYVPDSTVQSIGDSEIMRYSVSDTGTEQFYTNGS